MKIYLTPPVRRQRPFRRRSGFTLLEMVIVLGIIAMILGGAIFSMRNIGQAANLKQVDGDFKSIETALSMYRLNAGPNPTTEQGLNALVNKPTTTPIPRRWERVMDSVPKDPWGNDYVYIFPGRKDASRPEILSKGKDGQQGTDDDLSSQDE